MRYVSDEEHTCERAHAYGAHALPARGGPSLVWCVWRAHVAHEH